MGQSSVSSILRGFALKGTRNFLYIDFSTYATAYAPHTSNFPASGALFFSTYLRYQPSSGTLFSSSFLFFSIFLHRFGRGAADISPFPDFASFQPILVVQHCRDILTAFENGGVAVDLCFAIYNRVFVQYLRWRQ